MKDKELTLEKMPPVVVEIDRKLEMIIAYLHGNENDEDYLMTMEELIKYLPEDPARQTVYGWINARRIPYEKHGKRLYFRRSEIDNWLKNGRPYQN